MPKYRWQEIDYGMAQGERVLNFRKGPEKCTISFHGGGSWMDPTYITVNVAWTGTHMSAPMGPTPLPEEYYDQSE